MHQQKIIQKKNWKKGKSWLCLVETTDVINEWRKRPHTNNGLLFFLAMSAQLPLREHEQKAHLQIASCFSQHCVGARQLLDDGRFDAFFQAVGGVQPLDGALQQPVLIGQALPELAHFASEAFGL